MNVSWWRTPDSYVGLRRFASLEVDRQHISDRALRDIDILVLPTLNGTVPAVAQARGNPRALSSAFTVFATYFGLRAIGVPAGSMTTAFLLALSSSESHRTTLFVLSLAHWAPLYFLFR
jgi:Asp-tRNA(Asn)/Glu-tRNA(Gln) amidotransferase A subunit family amidase